MLIAAFGTVLLPLLVAAREAGTAGGCVSSRSRDARQSHTWWVLPGKTRAAHSIYEPGINSVCRSCCLALYTSCVVTPQGLIKTNASMLLND
jgi:hypothetical protein